ncbi:hypothetical protein [Undibacterium rugosum]|uniref:hypothetical protein n=1 Tax=Undibacterium rugosum TaxID=2762291 RepID=UPI001B827C4C|nr:hypothetical protein [Undibacterium rugosum]MBR7780361.1 hypothetical protein [Undibacterium rugosum]
MKIKKSASLPLVIVCSLTFSHVHAQQANSSPEFEIVSKAAHVQFGFEKLNLPQNETMGLLGGAYLLRVNEAVEIGPAAYGAISGKRGGFFTGGAELAFRRHVFADVYGKAGLYAGGGGGGAAAVGGGLMLRPHIDLTWKSGRTEVGLSLSQVRFPNGHIRSNQAGLVVGFDTDFNYADSATAGRSFAGLGRGGIGFDRMQITGGVFQPRHGIADLGAKLYEGSLGYAGFRSEQFLSGNVLWGIEAGAAVKGGADGYAEILGGVAYEIPVFSESVHVGSRFSVGMGGGGKVPTGGGLIAKAGLYSKIDITPDVFVTLEGGLVDAPDGQFKAKYGTLNLGIVLDDVSRSRTDRTIRGMEWAASIQHYVKASRYSGGDQALSTMGLKINRDLNSGLFMSAQAHSGFSGNAGGYSVGLAGLGMRSENMAHGLGLSGEILAGAAGGGGVNSQGGAIVQSLGYLTYGLNRYTQLKFGVGRVKSLKGQLNSTIVDATISIPFGVPSK